MHFPPDHGVIVKISDNSLWKVEKCIFVKFLGSQNCSLAEKMALKKTLPDRNLSLKYHYRTGIWPQISLLDGNLALKYNYWTRIRLFHPVRIFESPIPVRLCLLRAKLLSVFSPLQCNACICPSPQSVIKVGQKHKKFPKLNLNIHFWV